MSARGAAAETTSSRGLGVLRRDAGVVTLEAVIIAPALILATFGIVQAVLFYMASTSVTNASQLALQTARVETSTAADGESAARDYLAGQFLVEDPQISVARGEGEVAVTTTATAPSLVPFVDLPQVSSELTGPVERVTDP